LTTIVIRGACGSLGRMDTRKRWLARRGTAVRF
jgi:hypothetical protein